ncbi:MAG: DUF1559 domain-containing protein [Actinobacteria bacterium]|nr:DUF1559 domain-containing protein [Actinomycetota bacterium]
MQCLSKDSCRGGSLGGSLRTADAFTLIEVLITVAIVALLTSVLVPVMNSARGLAQQIQCQSNQRNIALAMRMYIDSFNGYLPGSPNTSGAGPRKILPETVVATNAFDYASPLLGFLNTSVPANRADRQELTRLGVFKCPTNDHRSEPWTGYQSIPDAADFTTSQASSYLTCWNFLLAGDGYAGAQVTSGVYYWLYGATWTEVLPRDFLPKITKIGLPSRKVFLADAARYVDEGGQFTYDIGYSLFGAGGYSGSGAWWIDSREYGQYSPAADYSYRHDDGIAAVFYDGHCEYLSREQSYRAEYWYPKGTVITDGSEGAGGEPSGYVVP